MSGKYRLPILGIFLGITAVSALSQTQINLQSQGRDVDFSAAPSTKPAETGTFLPTSCSAGAVFVLLSNPPGQNVFVCTSSNTWSVQAGGGGSAPNTPALTASATVLSIGANCGPSSPCNVRVGSTIYAFTNGVTATISGGTGTAYIYISSLGVLTVGHGMTVACAGGCIAQSGITTFPNDSYPIAIWTASNGAWSPSGQDVRATLGRDLVTAGNGLTAGTSGGATTLNVPGQEAGFAVAFRGTDVAAGQTVFLTIPYACSITDWTITSDGTATIQLWRVTDGGTEVPNTADSMNTNGFSLVSGNRIHSATLTDLNSTSIYAFDTIGVNLTATGSAASHVEFSLGCSR